MTASFKHLFPDIVVMIASLYLSLYLRVGFDEFGDHLGQVYLYLPMVVGVRLLVFLVMGVYNIYWRYVSAVDAFRIIQAALVASAAIISLSFFISWEYGRLPRTVYLIDTILSTIMILGMRLTKRMVNEKKHGRQIRQGKRTLIYGAGDLGRIVANYFRTDPGQGTRLVGFIDDDKRKHGMSVANRYVLGGREDLPSIIENRNIAQVIIAASEIPSEVVREVVQLTRPYNIRPRIVSNTRLLDEDQKRNLEIDREINLSDLLNRQPRHVDVLSVREMIRGKRVLVTGAGGSIGSEIARQVLDHDPSRLILLDHSEYALFEIDKELRLSTTSTNKVVPLLLDLKDHESLDTNLREYNPQVIIHAAAYKHVHLVEANPFSSILNNVLSTQNLLELAQELNVGSFILISSDKAVNPAGVMGATKRVCEMLVTLAGHKLNRNYCSVRFGNVLGSSGSLIPTWQQQIREGGPVTVTHRDMTRYFMLIPEAVSLVLKAATISKPGDISVLDMGEPIRILDIAKSMIALSGKTEDEIALMFTGLRPGEKLYEELYLSGNEVKTEHPDIMTLPRGELGTNQFEKDANGFIKLVASMISNARHGHKEALHELSQLVQSTYVPPDHVAEESAQVNILNKH